MSGDVVLMDARTTGDAEVNLASGQHPVQLIQLHDRTSDRIRPVLRHPGASGR